MKKYLLLVLGMVSMALISCGSLIGTPSINTDVPSLAEWTALWQSLGAWKGIGTLGLASVVVQFLLLAARSKFDPLPATAKLAVVTALTMLVGILGAHNVAGLDLAASTAHSGVLTAIMVFLNQLWNSIWSPKAAVPPTVGLKR